MKRRQIDNVRWQCTANADTEFLKSVPQRFAGPEPEPDTRAITWSRKKKALIIDDAYIVKQYTYLTRRDRLWAWLVLPPAEMEAHRARRVATLDIPTVVPEATGTASDGFLPTASYVVVRKISGARDLEAIFEDEPPVERRRALIEKLALLTRQIHDAAVDQYDYNPSNFLVLQDDSLRLIDMGRVNFHVELTRHQVIENLARLLRAARRLGVSPADCLRFLRTYTGEDRLCHESRRLARSVAGRSEDLLSKRDRKIRIDCVGTGRRFYELSCSHGAAYVAIGEYGERRCTAEELQALMEKLDRGLNGAVAFGPNDQLKAEAIKGTDAMAHWQDANVEYFRGLTRARPVALVLALKASYLLTEPQERA